MASAEVRISLKSFAAAVAQMWWEMIFRFGYHGQTVMHYVLRNCLVMFPLLFMILSCS